MSCCIATKDFSDIISLSERRLKQGYLLKQPCDGSFCSCFKILAHQAKSDLL